MIIFLKNKHTLKVGEFYFKCCIGKRGITKRKLEGDKKTPSGNFKIGHLYFRKDRVEKPSTKVPVYLNKKQKELLEQFREIENEKSNPSIKKFFQKAKSFWKN